MEAARKWVKKWTEDKEMEGAVSLLRNFAVKGRKENSLMGLEG